MSDNLQFLGPGRYWQQPNATSPRQKHTLQTELELEPFIRRAIGSLSSQRTSFAGVSLYIKYNLTNVCPCGIVFHFKPDAAGRSACKKALKAHMQTHEGVHFWDLTALKSSQEKHVRYLNQRYAGAAILPFERWAIPHGYNAPENVAQLKRFFFNFPAANPTPPPSTAGSTVPSRQASSPLSSINESHSGQDAESENDDDFAPDSLISPKKIKFSKNEIFCVCKKPDDGKVYFECECGFWCHPACVGIKKTQGKLVTTFYCPTCESADDSYRVRRAGQAKRRQRDGTPIVATSLNLIDYRYNEWPVIIDPMVIEVVYELSDED